MVLSRNRHLGRSEERAWAARLDPAGEPMPTSHPRGEVASSGADGHVTATRSSLLALAGRGCRAASVMQQCSGMNTPTKPEQGEPKKTTPGQPASPVNP